MNSLGVLYENGLGVPRNYTQARQWYEKAAVAGWPASMNSLGVFYQNGWAVAQDYIAGAAMVRKGRRRGKF